MRCEVEGSDFIGRGSGQSLEEEYFESARLLAGSEVFMLQSCWSLGHTQLNNRYM